MVNANVIISVSAVLVALLLTIVIVMRADGDPGDNFSVTVKGKAFDDGAEYDADMYYCTGEDCVFYKYIENTPVDYIFSPGNQFPGYFALVGFTDSASGDTYVTEHSIGYTFTYNSGSLTSCVRSEELDASDVATSAADMANAFDATDKSIYQDGEKVYTITEYSVDTNPADDTPTVNGHGVPSVYECKLLWAAEDAAACSAATGVDCGTDFVYNPADAAAFADVPEGGFTSEENNSGGTRRLAPAEHGRELATVATDTLAHLAQWVYKNDDSPELPTGWTEYATCEVIWTAVLEYGRSTARVAYNKNSVVVAFVGSNDAADWMYNADIRNKNSFHRGFHDYVMDVKECVDDAVNNIGRNIDYVVGHSLGGAAASTYNQMSSGILDGAKVVTWGAPKNRYLTSCTQTGMRFFHNHDPVPSNMGAKGFGALGSFSHDVTSATMVYNRNGDCAEWGRRLTWGGWERGSCKKYDQILDQTNADCEDMSSTTADIEKHGMGNYRKHNLNDISV